MNLTRQLSDPFKKMFMLPCQTEDKYSFLDLKYENSESK